ncbi:MAG: ABC transporter permease [Candidatus Rokubacteria bacterium]|nr:ABC transporter permease [Candidatus Rokubacteria bacterium]
MPFGLGGLVGLAIAWEITARAIDKEIFLVSFSRVLADLAAWLTSGDMTEHLVASGTEFVLGFGLSIVLGLLVGGAMGLSRTAQRILGPLVSGLYSTPLIALTPLFVIWLGFGLSAKVALVMLVSLFPIIINTETGIRQVDPAYLDAVRAFGASPLQLVAKVRVPAALPFLFAGMRISVARATTGIFVAELFGARAGIGYSIINAAASFNTARLLSGIVILAGFGVVMSWLIGVLGDRAAPWRVTEERESR